jgi:hypothetical protein
VTTVKPTQRPSVGVFDDNVEEDDEEGEAA